jgi:hypothetical protein
LVIAQLYLPPLTPALSPEYEGEGVALRKVLHVIFDSRVVTLGLGRFGG